MNFNNFIVVDQSFSKKRTGSQTFTVAGQQLYQIGVSIPVIRKGDGCIGVAVIEMISISQTSTTISFNLSPVNEADAKAYYKLYQNNVSSGGTDDMSDQEDVIIPGAMLGRSSDRNKRPSRRSSGGSLMDYFD